MGSEGGDQVFLRCVEQRDWDQRSDKFECQAILSGSLLALLAVDDGLNDSFIDAVLTKERVVADVMLNEVQSIGLDLC